MADQRNLTACFTFPSHLPPLPRGCRSIVVSLNITFYIKNSVDHLDYSSLQLKGFNLAVRRFIINDYLVRGQISEQVFRKFREEESEVPFRLSFMFEI